MATSFRYKNTPHRLLWGVLGIKLSAQWLPSYDEPYERT